MDYTLRYRNPAIDSDYGWEHQSLPIGNGWLGANIFGIVGRERIQITENTLQNPGDPNNMGGLNNFAELYLHFEHSKVTDYERGLRLNDAVAYTHYKVDGVQYHREYFTSYPDRVLIIRLTAEQPFSVGVELTVPYVKAYAKQEGDGGGKSGSVTYEGNLAHLRGVMDFYNIRFAGELAVTTNGAVSASDMLRVENATQVTIFLAVGTNYELRPEVFLEDDPKKKLRDFDPAEAVAERLETALKKGYDAVCNSHLQDYCSLFGRVELDLGEEETTPTDKLLKAYARGKHSRYLEMLYFQYGRYLLISSSRKGTLPANLQGVWNVHDHSPWGSGYWHNINVQMNYWPAFPTNLAETFDAYADFNAAFRPKAEQLAREYIQKTVPEKKSENCGWTVGTAVYPYTIEAPGGHSGPGTGGLTSKLFWDHYDFTRNEDVLKKVAYPALRGMSRFLTKTVDDGEVCRAVFSASPEQVQNKQYYHTTGCAFDQQMIWENGRDYLATAELLGAASDEAYALQKQQLSRYHPVRIGASGQIKEFGEETHYGQIGEYRHRHISQLVGLHPGTLINQNTPAWLDAAKYTLQERGDRSTGWALAHRLNAWARTGDGDHAYKLLRNLIGKRTMENLWDFHPPFQIDGNFGGTAGIAEMLLQSHDGYIRILPALPKAWAKKGSYKGLVARGAFEVAVAWENGTAKEITVTSKVGGTCVIRYPRIGEARLQGTTAETEEDSLQFDTDAGKTYRITDIPVAAVTKKPMRLWIFGNKLYWLAQKGVTYRLYRNMDDSPDYELLAEVSGGSYPLDAPCGKEYVMYKLTAQRSGERESEGVVCTRNDLYWKQRLRHGVKRAWIVLKGEFLGECYDFGLWFIDLVQKYKGQGG